MKNLFITILFTICCVASAAAQGESTGYPRSVYVSETGRTRSAQEVETMKRIYDNRRRDARTNDLKRRTEAIMNNSAGSESSLTIGQVAKKYVSPNKSYLTKYKSFLQLPNTGIVSLGQTGKCTTNNKSLNNIVKKCPFDFIDGAGKSFSFRRKDYVFSKWSDIEIKDNWIYSFGLDNQGILVDLGDTRLEDLSLASKGIDFLADFTPSSKTAEVQLQSKKFSDGIKAGNFSYAKVLPVELNKTYGLRVVAYQSNSVEEIKSKQTSSRYGTVNDPFFVDSREDIIVVFKVIGKELDGTITVIWKELQRKASPELVP